ncbi:heparinase II/III family protein [Komagataeibacter sp. FNDCF1]|uniref:heparinase II/III family protein n=1 Tax=Komagataeibacter sp. FNDCF1 TaxID=2878681 RepID=UPI001E49EEFA|nr:heparinase II/III family protein [Komagataeibacter sp. FNDCF1]MCE2565750.1 heparinase II/III family protein [Komagataeibacter sp. FNDCF1]
MPLKRLTRGARLSLARLSLFGGGRRLPAAPVHHVRDLWPGNPAAGALLVRGSLTWAGYTHPVGPGLWDSPAFEPAFREGLLGFRWLRDLRAVGTDAARLKARALVDDWLHHPAQDPLALECGVIGARVAAWLGHYDFFAASASDAFRQRLMARILVEGRTIAALMPPETQGWQTLAALKGLLAVAVAMPEYTGFLARYRRYIDAAVEGQILPDGWHVERSPEVQLRALRELAEMRAMMQAVQHALPHSVALALDKMSPVLRAMRHGDGGLALFNGSHERSATLIEMVLSQATRTRVVASSMPDGGFVRMQAARTLLLVDAGIPAPPDHDHNAHAGTLSFEFSCARQRLIVNCGGGVLPAWKEALRQTAAHSVVVVEDMSSSEFGDDGTVRRKPTHVGVEHAVAEGAHWLNLSHDGYHASAGATYYRRLYLGADGETLRGEEMLEGERELAFVLRLHLHPSVTAVDALDGSILLTGGEQHWRFRAMGGTVGIEESVYSGGQVPRPTLQLVVRVDPAARADATGSGALPGQPPVPQGSTTMDDVPPGRVRQVVRWALQREKLLLLA